MPDYYTWKQFLAAVDDLLDVDSNRDGTAAFKLAKIRQCVIQLQTVFDEFTVRHEAIYHPYDMVTYGHASAGVKPPQSAIQDVYLVQILDRDTDKQRAVRFPLEPFDWKNRMAMVNGDVCVNTNHGYIAVDPQGYEFYLYPECFDCWMVSMFWNGHKLDFKDDEETPFSEQMAGAVATYVKAQFALLINHDANTYMELMKQYGKEKPLLYLSSKAKREIRMVGVGGGLSGVATASGDAVCVGESSVAVNRCVQQVFSYPGNPNGFVPPLGQLTELPLMCIDTANLVTWTKDDGLATNTGWH